MVISVKKSKGSLILSIFFSCILLLVVIVFATASGKRPFKNLDSSKIVSAKVQLTPPGKTIQIIEINELAGYLNDVVIYHKDNSYTEYDGQGVIFTLLMEDGTQTEIMAYNPFLIIDGVGYRTKYEPCETLNSYANRLLNEEDALVILEEPPALDIISSETYHETLLGTYSWQRKNDDGTFTGIQADSRHPLDCKDSLFPLEMAEITAVLRFTENPDTLSVCCWSDEHWSDIGADSERVAVEGYQIELKPGGYIYEVRAKWDTEKSGYGGTAYYSFYVKTLSDVKEMPLPENLPTTLASAKDINAGGGYLLIGELPEENIRLYCDNSEERNKVYIQYEEHFQMFEQKALIDPTILPELNYTDWDEDGVMDLVVDYLRHEGTYFDGKTNLPGVVGERVVYQWNGEQWMDIHFTSGGPLIAVCSSLDTFDSHEITGSISSTMDESFSNIVLQTGDALRIREILDEGIWNNEGTADCISDCIISIDDEKVYYHSCGTFNDEANQRCLMLDEETKFEVNSIFEKYIALSSAEMSAIIEID